MTLFYLSVLAVIGKSVPGYKNYYGLRLKRLLVKHVPNIANTDGYRVDGWKINSSSSEVIG